MKRNSSYLMLLSFVFVFFTYSCGQKSESESDVKRGWVDCDGAGGFHPRESGTSAVVKHCTIRHENVHVGQAQAGYAHCGANGRLVAGPWTQAQLECPAYQESILCANEVLGTALTESQKTNATSYLNHVTRLKVQYCGS
jgi:hypothetical protein